MGEGLVHDAARSRFVGHLPIPPSSRCVTPIVVTVVPLLATVAPLLATVAPLLATVAQLLISSARWSPSSPRWSLSSSRENHIVAPLLATVAPIPACRYRSSNPKPQILALQMAAAVRVVPPSEAKQLVDSGYVFLDVRTPQEYASGHVAGSSNIPFMLTASDGSMVRNAEFLDQVKAKYSHDTPLVLACRSGKRSNMAANALREVGYTSLADMEAPATHVECSSTPDNKNLSFLCSVPQADLACSTAQPPAPVNLLSTSLRVLPATLGRVFAVSALLLVALSTVSQYRDLQAAAIMAQPPFPVLPPLEVHRLVDGQGYVYLDVRTAEEFAQVHVPGSDLIPYLITAPDGSQQPNPHYLQQVKAKYALDTPLIVVHCHTHLPTHSVKHLEARASLSSRAAPFPSTARGIHTVQVHELYSLSPAKTPPPLRSPGLSQRQEVQPGSVGDDGPGIHKARGSQGGHHRMGGERVARGEAQQQA
ncbi:unnamed protein product [Closterium sp. Yama58-4]|nr:unnamed protein product [Closterium sp. Yama58-4]